MPVIGDSFRKRAAETRTRQLLGRRYPYQNRNRDTDKLRVHGVDSPQESATAGHPTEWKLGPKATAEGP